MRWIALSLSLLAVHGCTTVGSLYADAEAKCKATGWNSQECAYAQRRAETSAMRPQGAAAAAIISGTRAATQPPRRY